ncbi:putative DNA-directed RNA polymerases I and III subunit RPAC2-like [Sesbania bispinosa]|nr:putative DNA-directed RNA polymerases I and III subunit RPAC2-like [Sesbania bispinosa]
MTRDASTQSTPPYLSSSNPSTAFNSFHYREINKLSEDSLNSDDKSKSEEEVEVKDKETWESTEEQCMSARRKMSNKKLRNLNPLFPLFLLPHSLYFHMYKKGDPAREVLKDASQDLMFMCQHVRSTFDKAVNDLKRTKPVQAMDTK